MKLAPIESDHACGFWFRSDARCVLRVNREISTRKTRREPWRPQLRLCHIHALQMLTGKVVMMPDALERERMMLALAGG
jgi:hypothetical protein